MMRSLLISALSLAGIFIKEQLKEPSAFFWILLSPAGFFYLLAYSKGPDYFLQPYSSATAWFYAYISLNVALFGFSFYIIGRRESGFMRSFIYTLRAKHIFVIAQVLAYSTIALMYCFAFYLMTRLPFGTYSAIEALHIGLKFYSCFILLCIPGALLTLPPLNFQTSNTLFSIISFTLLALGIAQTALPDTVEIIMHSVNILNIGKGIMHDDIQLSRRLIAMIFIVFGITLIIVCKHLRINPVWSRY